MNPDDMEAEDNEKFDIDFTGVTTGAKDFRIPAGEHPARVTNVVKTLSQNTGSPQLEWQFELVDLPGKTIRRWTTLNPTARWMLKGDLEAMDLIPEGSTKCEFSRRDAIGRYVILQIRDDDYNGKKTSKIERVKNHPDGAVQVNNEPKF